MSKTKDPKALEICLATLSEKVRWLLLTLTFEVQMTLANNKGKQMGANVPYIVAQRYTIH